MTVFTKTTRDITSYKPKMKAVYVSDLSHLRVIPFVAGITTCQVKADGEFNLLHLDRRGAYCINRFGRMTTELPALKEAHRLYMEHDKPTSAFMELLAEMYGVDENGKPVSLPNFIHMLKGGDEKLHDRIHLGIFGMTAGLNSTALFPILEDVFNGKLCHVLPWIIPTNYAMIEGYYEDKIREGWEGLVIRTNGDTYKAKPNCDVDAVVIGINKTAKGYARGLAKSVRVALMPTENTFMEIGDATIPAEAEARELFALTRVKVNEDGETVFVKPLVVVTINYISLFSGTTNAVRKLLLGGMMEVGTMKGVRMKSPRVVGYRKDKHACTADVGMNQIIEEVEQIVEKR